MEMMCELLRQKATPELETDLFDGNSMDFDYFLAAFKEAVENKVTDPRGRLFSLIKFKKGKANEIAKNYIQLLSVVGFKTAKRLLNERFGDPHIITESYRKEIKQWIEIKVGNADAYKRFQNFLVKCENLEHLQICKVLNTPHIICMLLSKLPGKVSDKRWYKISIKSLKSLLRKNMVYQWVLIQHHIRPTSSFIFYNLSIQSNSFKRIF